MHRNKQRKWIAKLSMACLLQAVVTLTAQAVVKPVIPTNGVYIGAVTATNEPNVLNSTMGVHQSIYGQYYSFPDIATASWERVRVSNFVKNCKSASAIPMLTVEPSKGLTNCTSAHFTQLATLLNSFDTPILLRFGHEMNGNWYAWGQQPALYISTFKTLANIIHSNAPGVAMAWTPNQGWGYPFGGSVSTNGGAYAPYYPGDTYVDWVGLSLFFLGDGNQSYSNDMPNNVNHLAESLTSLDFYQSYAFGKAKPMIICETGIYYAPAKTSLYSQLSLKTEWINQVYNLTATNRSKLNINLPWVKAICWLEEKKLESGTMVDWRISADNGVKSYYMSKVAGSYFLKYASNAVAASAAPTVTTLAGALAATDSKAYLRTNCYADYFQVSGKVRATIQMNGFDTYLYLYDTNLNFLVSNNDANGTLNAQMWFSMTNGVKYYIEATSKANGVTGAYTLLVSNAAVMSVANPFKKLVKGSMTSGDLKSNSRWVQAGKTNCYADYYNLTTESGSTTITLDGTGYDAYLYLYNQSWGLVASDDNSAGTLDSRITYTLPANQTFYVEATTFGTGATGTYRLISTLGTLIKR